jgi:Ala-tRNA(Pro) deacylase
VNRRLEEFLASRLARYEVVAHPDAFTAQEQAALAHTSGWSWAKAVVVKTPDRFVLAVLPAPRVIELGRLTGLIGRGPIALASLEELLRLAPDCEPGAIPPFGSLFGLATLADQDLVNQPELVMPAGDRRTAIRMRATEFVRLAAPRVGRFAVQETSAASRPGA